MKSIQVYDPPMCCPTGICGTDIAFDLVSFAGMLSEFRRRGIQIERHNLAQEPMAFANNPTVKAALASDGTKALPMIFWDGEVKLQGRYPNKAERPDWIRAAGGSGEVSS